MPDAAPHSLHCRARVGELDGVLHPTPWFFHSLILALRAVHPAERHLLESERCPAEIVPQRLHIGGTGAEPVAVGKPTGRVVRETGALHLALGLPHHATQEMLAHAADATAGDGLEPGALCREPRAVEDGLHAAVQPDLVTSRLNGPHKTAHSRGLGEVGDVCRTNRGERGGCADDEPGGACPDHRLRGQHGFHAAADRVAGDLTGRRRKDARRAGELTLAREFGHTEERERGPQAGDVKVVRERRGPLRRTRPGRHAPDGTVARRFAHGVPQRHR